MFPQSEIWQRNIKPEKSCTAYPQTSRMTSKKTKKGTIQGPTYKLCFGNDWRLNRLIPA